MSDPLIKPFPLAEAIPESVTTEKHPFDWGGGVEPEEATEARLGSLGDQVLVGAWYLNPRYTVHAPVVSGEFFRDARHARRRWLKEVRGSISLQRESRSVVANARRVALANLDLAGANPPHLSPPPVSGTPQECLEARQFGHIAKQLAFSGLMIIDGEHVFPRTWNALADRLLGPERSPTHRPAQRHKGHAGRASRRSTGPTNQTNCSQEERQP